MDDIFGTGRNDILIGFANLDDSIFGRGGNDFIRGLGGHDSLYGEDGKDLLDGGAGNDRLDGGKGVDALFGGAGRDLLVGGAGHDVIEGGAGTDTAAFSGNAADYLIRSIFGLTFVTDLKPKVAGDDGKDTLVDVERLQFADQLVFLTPNAQPVLRDDAVATNEDEPITIAGAALLINDSDADGDPFMIVGVGNGANGTAVLNDDGTITYTPNADFNGTDTFTYQVSDGLGTPVTATVTVTVNPVDDAPTADTVSASGLQNAAFIPITLTGSDIDAGDAVATFKLAELPVNGTLYLDEAMTIAAVAGTEYAATDNALTLFFKPDPGFSGTASFQFTADDDELESAPALATIEVVPVADDPLVISNFIIEGTTPNSVMISWDTDEPSTTRATVKNVTTGVTIIETEENQELVTHHVITIPGLTANTLYVVRGISEVPGVKSSISDERAFRTPR